MKILKTFLFFTFCSSIALAQHVSQLPDLTPDKNFDNIFSRKISSDSLASSFLIWVKKGVKPHKHLQHTEQVYVISGTGKMLLGKKEVDIMPGSFIFIPKNTVHSVQVTSKTPIKVISIQTPYFSGKDRVFID